MVSADMCEHDWPGSGCPECRERSKHRLAYGLKRDGTKIEPPPGWVILPKGKKVPNLHREFVEDAVGYSAWLNTRRTRSTMTAITAQVWGNVRAYAVPC